jgi:endonuclease/exonuclease/phosphatase (EEP) superfamily protein YafD
MSVEIIIFIAAIVVLLLILGWLFKVFQASVTTLLIIAAILIVLQVVFGINSQQFIQEFFQIINRIRQAIFS